MPPARPSRGLWAHWRSSDSAVYDMLCAVALETGPDDDEPHGRRPDMTEISWADFEKVELRVGTILEVRDFPGARKPAFILSVDFGDFGIKTSSAQITGNYAKEQLIGRQVLAVINFPRKQIAHVMSECLTTGVLDERGNVVLVAPDRRVPNGAKLF
jgi:tRNA-binding protein